MSAIQRPPDFHDDMRDLFEDSEDENAEISGEQSLGPSTQQTSSEHEQADTKRKRSEDETPTSLNDGDQGDLVCFLLLMLTFSAPDAEIESDSKEASSKLRH